MESVWDLHLPDVIPNAFPLCLGSRQWCSHDFCSELASAVRQVRGKRSLQIEMEGIKLSLCPIYMILYGGVPKESTKELLQLVGEGASSQDKRSIFKNQLISFHKLTKDNWKAKLKHNTIYYSTENHERVGINISIYV